jgi:hypothetical protein
VSTWSKSGNLSSGIQSFLAPAVIFMSSPEVLNATENGHPLGQTEKGTPEDPPPPAEPPAEESAPEYEEIAAVIPIMGLGDDNQTGTFTSSSKEIALKLFKQRSNDETDVPAYGRGATISGEASLLFGIRKGIKEGSVRQVTIKVSTFHLDGPTTCQLISSPPACRIPQLGVIRWLPVQKDLHRKGNRSVD